MSEKFVNWRGISLGAILLVAAGAVGLAIYHRSSSRRNDPIHKPKGDPAPKNGAGSQGTNQNKHARNGKSLKWELGSKPEGPIQAELDRLDTKLFSALNQTLLERGKEVAFNYLVGLLEYDQDDLDHRFSAARGLCYFAYIADGEPGLQTKAVEVLRSSLEHRDPWVRKVAMGVLGNLQVSFMGIEAEGKTIVAFVGFPKPEKLDPASVEAKVLPLKHWQDASFISAMANLARNDPDAQVRSGAIQSLSLFAMSPEVEAVARHLARSDPEPVTRLMAIEALARAPNQESFETALLVLRDDKADPVRIMAATTLHGMVQYAGAGTDQAVAEIVSSQGASSLLRSSALSLAAAMYRKSPTTWLVQALQSGLASKDASCAVIAADAMGASKDRTFLPHLHDARRSYSDKRAIAAIERAIENLEKN